MTWRAIILGLLCAAGIGGFCYFHDCVINAPDSTRLVPNLMPCFIYGALLIGILVLIVWPRRRGWKWTFTKAELALITAMALVTCSVPFYGLVNCWPSALMLPHYLLRTTPGWSQEHVLDLVSPRLLANPECRNGDALTGYVTGMATGTGHIALSDVPWEAWTRPLLIWVPLALAITLATLGLAAVFHRQWMHHEQLPYPITSFAGSLLPDADGKSIFTNRWFLAAAGAVTIIHMVNYLCLWWPQTMIPIRLRLDFSPLAAKFPLFIAGDGWSLFTPKIMFSVIGITYFFASDVALSLTLAPIVMCLVIGLLSDYGISVTKGFSMYNNTTVFMYTGGYFGVLLAVLYTGRHYYRNVLAASVGVRNVDKDATEPQAVWGMRLFLVGTTVFVILLMVAGLDWPMALIFTGIALMVLIVVSRTVAETGAFYIGTWILPCAMVWGLMGGRAVGPETLAVMVMASVVVLIGPGWSPMPFMVQSLHLADIAGAKVSKATVWCIVAVVLALAVALPATIYWQYDRGVMTASSGWARYSARLPFDKALEMKRTLEAQGVLAEAEQVRGLARFAHLTPKPAYLGAFLIMAALTLACAFCRLRFPWWPIHPIAFVFLNSHQAQMLYFSFFLGWMIKSAVTRYGGSRMYQQFKPVMVGLVAGEVLAGLIPLIVGLIYYLITGLRAPGYFTMT
ncbi:MAG: hypothetical protein A3K19_08345 [Lentisphaerae bacterium RIFOXYB12_FULL_65_16]|nr:MAG: hypothetical protein A3K18_05030 [Lentisphaerae bacterium RIFOXYA12_64_32]OGV84990.1 MAG: hypothetical protein A3K19_08345 [Lentisphaerae bacterium RIFOXYB12_FULL_65_16]